MLLIVLPLPSRLSLSLHRILNRSQQAGYLGHHLENSEDICTSHHKVLLPKVKEGAGEAGKIQRETFLWPKFPTCAPPQWRGGRCGPCWTCSLPSLPLWRAAAVSNFTSSHPQAEFSFPKQFSTSSEIQSRDHKLRDDNTKNLKEYASCFLTLSCFDKYNFIFQPAAAFESFYEDRLRDCGSMQSKVGSTNILCRAPFTIVFGKKLSLGSLF